jgi:hydrogenase assembly chaperone HypC/HupF
VVEVEEGGGFATIELAGRLRRVCLTPLELEGRAVQVGEWVLVHTGLAVEVVDEAAAMEVVAAREEMR